MRGPLRRSRHGLLAGVCAGLAAWLGWKPWVVRAVFLVGSLVPVLPGALVYLVLWVLMPREPAASSAAAPSA